MKIHVYETTYQPWEEGQDEPNYETVDGPDIDVDGAREAVETLLHEGPLEASCSPPCQNSNHCWLRTIDADKNYRTGESTERSFHLSGFSPGTHGRIIRLVTKSIRRFSL